MFSKMRQYFVDKAVVEDVAKKYLSGEIEKAVRLLSSDMRSVAAVVDPDPEILNKVITLQTAYTEAYMMNTTVAACVNLIADSVSSVPKVLMQRNKKTGVVTQVKDHPALTRLNNPNNYQDSITYSKVQTQHYLLAGNSLVWINTNRAGGEAVKRVVKNPVVALEIFNPDDFNVVTQDGRRPKHYEVREEVWQNKSHPNKYPKRVFLPEEIIHFIDNPDPIRPYWGMGRIQSAYRSIDLDSQIVSWWLETVRRGCRKDALIKFKKDLTDIQFRRIRSQIEQQVAGFNSGRGFMILGREHDVEFLNMSPAEMDFKESKKDTARNIMAIMRVPSILLDPEQSSYNNMSEANKSLWLNNILMMCNNFANLYTKQLIPLYVDLANDTDHEYWFSYDFSKVDALVQQYGSLVKQAVDLIGVGLSRDQVNQILDMGWNSSPGSDKSYISVNLISEEERAQRMELARLTASVQQQQVTLRAGKEPPQQELSQGDTKPDAGV